HLLNMKYFLQNATNRTLFLIDEMGGGTDPHMGGAIAESVLDKLSQKACYGLVTTHFSNLKLMAAPDNNIENGAMLFNTEALEPLYILQTGFPGSSFTIEIAKKIGFPHDVITSLQGKVNQKQLDFEVQLQQLDVERKALQQQKKSMDMSDQLLNETLEKYQNLYESLKADKQSIIREAKNEAKNMLMSSNKLIEKTIHDIKTTKADKTKTKQARQHIQEEITKLSDKKEDTSPKEIVHSIATKPLQPQKAKVKKEAPKVGDLVTIEGQTGSAVLESIKGKNAVVVMGNMRMRIAYNKLLKTSKKKTKKESKTAVYTKLADDINEKVLRFQPKIDIRGQRLEEALENTKQFIDEAIMLRMHEVHILHGKGTGVLRAHIRQYLQGIPEVAHVLDEHVDRGGHGITIVRFDL
ncbi:MAG: endonuclease MutS2, partial [Bacteroidia bacterium]